MRVDADDFARPCNCGKNHFIDVKEILIEAGAIEKLEEEMSDGFLKEYISPLLICDTNTYKATEEIMEDIYDRCQVLVLDADDLCADNHAVEIVENYMDEDIDIILAVGAGTIHDISRYVAHQYKIPFVSVPTAVSMDGFVSTIAVMNIRGQRKMIEASAPLCVYADTNIFAKAPKRLNVSGASDLLGKYICLADWEISHLLTEEPYCDDVAEMIYKILKSMRGVLRDLPDGDEEACEKLMYGLIAVALTAQMTGSDMLLRGAAHQMTALWDTKAIGSKLDATYGERISVASMEVFKEYKKIALAIEEGRCKVKSDRPDFLSEISVHRLEGCLLKIANIVNELPDEEAMEHLLDKAGCVKTAKEIGLSDEMISESLSRASELQQKLNLLKICKMLEYN